MFSELDPEELELVARVTSESLYEPGEVIYVDGDEGDEMLVLVDGSVRVTKTRGDRVELIRTYHAGEHVGELALLRGGSRIADVTAGDQGAHGIVLGRTEFRSIIEERPLVAVGMLETLADRIAAQT
jgi:CRP-like cAMP-binding protein